VFAAEALLFVLAAALALRIAHAPMTQAPATQVPRGRRLQSSFETSLFTR
jgi:BCD family chlorophyll transporter-like MFS transporter